MGRCNPVTKTCTRTPWWRSAMGIDWIGSSGQGGEVPETAVYYEDNEVVRYEDNEIVEYES